MWEPPQGGLSRALKDEEGAYQAVKSLLLFTSAWSIIAPTFQSHQSCGRFSGKVSDIYYFSKGRLLEQCICLGPFR